MADYISRADAINNLKTVSKMQGGIISEFVAIQAILSLPIADATEVIRCKDCKHYDIINQPYDEGFCRKLSYSVDGGSYCSYAERRDDE